ncbi:MAG: hypothetical protein INR72_16820, partial [Williamsia herbipolensis]|nr:hypothetical protein [Williamsia herbipolensis]
MATEPGACTVVSAAIGTELPTRRPVVRAPISTCALRTVPTGSVERPPVLTELAIAAVEATGGTPVPIATAARPTVVALVGTLRSGVTGAVERRTIIPTVPPRPIVAVVGPRRPIGITAVGSTTITASIAVIAAASGRTIAAVALERTLRAAVALERTLRAA